MNKFTFKFPGSVTIEYNGKEAFTFHIVEGTTFEGE